MCKELNKASPIVLLDEIFSYLDKNRKVELFNELLKLDIQSFITGTDISIFSDLIEKNVNVIDLERYIANS